MKIMSAVVRASIVAIILSACFVRAEIDADAACSTDGRLCEMDSRNLRSLQSSPQQIWDSTTSFFQSIYESSAGAFAPVTSFFQGAVSKMSSAFGGSTQSAPSSSSSTSIGLVGKARLCSIPESDSKRAFYISVNGTCGGYDTAKVSPTPSDCLALTPGFLGTAETDSQYKNACTFVCQAGSTQLACGFMTSVANLDSLSALSCTYVSKYCVVLAQ